MPTDTQILEILTAVLKKWANGKPGSAEKLARIAQEQMDGIRGLRAERRRNSSQARADSVDLWQSDETSKELHKFLCWQKVFPPEQLLDWKWWDAVAEDIDGIDITRLRRSFGAMAAWLAENPGRRPTPNGSRRFVRHWLENEHEKERLRKA